jgi:hypothetical protein
MLSEAFCQGASLTIGGFKKILILTGHLYISVFIDIVVNISQFNFMQNVDNAKPREQCHAMFHDYRLL